MGLNLAATSCTIPADIAQNAYFIASNLHKKYKINEIGLCLFEYKSCLQYDEKDLPQDLLSLPFYWHIHLPLDLSWNKGGKIVAKQVFEIYKKVQFLRPKAAVLHPPNFDDISKQTKLLQDFAKDWTKYSKLPILLENIKNAPLYTLPKSLFLNNNSMLQSIHRKEKILAFGICLDVGHMLSFGQEQILQHKDLLECIQMVHWSAPGNILGQDKHLSLTAFTPEQKDIAQQLLPFLPKNVCHVLEVFNENALKESSLFLQQFLKQS